MTKPENTEEVLFIPPNVHAIASKFASKESTIAPLILITRPCLALGHRAARLRSA